MVDPIRIHSPDDDDAVRKRHADIEARLEELGRDTVLSLRGHGLPTNWDPIINAWLKGDRLKADALLEAPEGKKLLRDKWDKHAAEWGEADGDDQRRR